MESNFERTGKHRILLVDDSPDILDVLKETLERSLPVRVDTSSSGADALQRMGTTDYDLVVSDYHMPGMDGLTFLGKAREKAPTTARIMITAATDLDVAVQAINDGAITGFFPKPIDARSLVEKVGHAAAERHKAIVKARGETQAADHFRREMVQSSGKDVGRPFKGALGDSTRR